MDRSSLRDSQAFYGIYCKRGAFVSVERSKWLVRSTNKFLCELQNANKFWIVLCISYGVLGSMTCKRQAMEAIAVWSVKIQENRVFFQSINMLFEKGEKKWIVRELAVVLAWTIRKMRINAKKQKRNLHTIKVYARATAIPFYSSKWIRPPHERGIGYEAHFFAAKRKKWSERENKYTD